MIFRKRWSFGLGTIFSLIVVYFIYLYSKSQGWKLLALISKWYLIIVGGLIALSIGLILLVVLFSLLVFLIAMLRLHGFKKQVKQRKAKKQEKEYIDAEYKLKD